MSRTGLSPADIAESFRDRCGDGSMEWVYTPMQTWVLLDAADMLDENAKLREQIHWLKRGDILHVLTDQEYIDQCERERLMQVSIDALDKENAKLRELAERAWKSAERLCQAFDGPCRDDGVTIAEPCPMGERDEECVYGQLQMALRECGVDV